MSNTETVGQPSAEGSSSAKDGTAAPKRSWARLLSPRRIGAVYVWILIIIIFSIWAPDTFPTSATVQSVLNQYALTGIVALGLVIPLSAGVFDLSLGANVALSGLVCAYLLGHGSSALTAIVLALVCGLLIGGVNALVVVLMRIDSFIGTLGTGAIITALAVGVSGQQILTQNVTSKLGSLGSTQLLGVTLPVYYMLAIMLVVGILLQRTVVGRRIYATGFDIDTARLAGVPVRRLRSAALVASAFVAAIGGVVLTSTLGSASTSEGPTYLLPAFAAAFLGATQFTPGRFNAWGTVVAVLMIGTGQVGILLVGAPAWAPDIFQGIVLIIAVGITGVERRGATTLQRRRRSAAAAAAAAEPQSGG